MLLARILDKTFRIVRSSGVGRSEIAYTIAHWDDKKSDPFEI